MKYSEKHIYSHLVLYDIFILWTLPSPVRKVGPGSQYPISPSCLCPHPPPPPPACTRPLFLCIPSVPVTLYPLSHVQECFGSSRKMRASLESLQNQHDRIYICLVIPCSATLIKKKIKFSSYIRKFRVEQLQSHVWLTASSYMGKYFCISSYIRKPFLIYDFATAPLWISPYMRKIFFSFLSVQMCGFNCTAKNFWFMFS